MKNNIQNIVNKKIAVLGYGVNNQRLVDWFLSHGILDITICDKNSKLEDNIASEVKKSGIKFKLGDDYLQGLDGFDIVFRTPGIAYLDPNIQQAQKNAVEISSQTKLFFDLCPGKIIGVTGTKGKGTTSTLIYKMLKEEFAKTAGSRKVYLAGNMGIDPFDFLDEIGQEDWVVMELSSFQLQDMRRSPNIAVVLNITSDHLDYHKDNEEYISAKANIVKYQTQEDSTVINQDYLTSFEFASFSPTSDDYYFSTKNSVDLGAYVDMMSKKIVFRGKDKEEKIIDINKIKLLGKHNLENVCAAICATKIVGVSNESIREILSSFSGNEHRLEFVSEIDGVKYYNDSASTNPDTTKAAILSFHKPIILIAGGSDKGLDYEKLKDVLMKNKIKKLVLMGETSEKIKPIVSHEVPVIKVDNMQEAVEEAKKEAVSGDVVLLSPASASFGIFANYQDRGKQFKEQVGKGTIEQ